MFLRKNSILPGFSLTFGLGMLYFSILIILPLCALVLFSMKLEFSEFIKIVTDKQVLRALKFSLICSFLAASINLFLGFILAWSLAKYEFLGKKLLNSLIDLPFALPTAVAGISLAYLMSSNGIIGKAFLKIGINLSEYDSFTVTTALVFITMPFVIRTLGPVIESMESESLEAATSLGASFGQIFWRIIVPTLLPSALTGFALAFARGLGEYGSVIFVSSNIPFKSEILPVVIVSKLDSFNYLGASAIGVFMIVVAFLLLLVINLLQKRSAK